MTASAPPGTAAVMEQFGRLDPSSRLAAVSYLVVVAVLVVDVVHSPELRRTVRPARFLSLGITAFVAVAVAVPFAAALEVVWRALGVFAPPGTSGTWARHPIVAFGACFVTVDLVAYLYHRAGHSWAIGWASHRVHHLGEQFDMTLVLRQPWLPLHGLVIFPLTALAGFSFATAAACSAVSLAYQATQHTSRSWGLGSLELLLISGRAHRRHHVAGAGPVNLGAVFSVWDRLFGSYAPAVVGSDEAFGLGEPERLDPWRNQVDGWCSWLVGRRRRDRAPDAGRSESLGSDRGSVS